MFRNLYFKSKLKFLKKKVGPTQADIDKIMIKKIMFAMKVGLKGVGSREEWWKKAEAIYICDDVIL